MIAVDPGTVGAGVSIWHDLQHPAPAMMGLLRGQPRRDKAHSLQEKLTELSADFRSRKPALVQELKKTGRGYILAVEGQRIYRGPKNRVNPEDIVQLAAAAGLLAQSAMDALREAGAPFVFVLTPAPEWKGQRDKPSHHASICRRCGWDVIRSAKGLVRPASHTLGTDSFEDWLDILDSVGLGQEIIRRIVTTADGLPEYLLVGNAPVRLSALIR